MHRHCRRVVHYDLGWNPAVVEQRTGRADRIGSKTFRERDAGATDLFLEVGLPFIAGTYDERMFEELRLRAQVFEILTGGDPSVDNREGTDDVGDADGQAVSLDFVPLPSTMLEDLRVKLHVWKEQPASGLAPGSSIDLAQFRRLQGSETTVSATLPESP